MSRNKLMRNISKLLLASGITLCSGCHEGEAILHSGVSKNWYQDYTYDAIELKNIQILEKNPFYKEQSVEEIRTQLERLIDTNPTLSELQKYWVFDLFDFLVIRIQQDPDYLFDALNQLQVETIQFTDETLQGAYANHLLLLDQNLSVEEEENTFKHELTHATTKRIYDGSKEYSAFSEGLASLISREYGKTPSRSNLNVSAMTCILIELVGTEPFYDMMNTGNIDVLKQTLLEINPSLDLENFLSHIEILYQRERRIQDNHDLITQIEQDIALLYQSKYQKSMEQNEAIMSYFRFLNKETEVYQGQYCYVFLDNCYFNQSGYPLLTYYDDNYHIVGTSSYYKTSYQKKISYR